VQLKESVKVLRADLELMEATHTAEAAELAAAHEKEVDALQDELDDLTQVGASQCRREGAGCRASRSRHFRLPSLSRPLPSAPPFAPSSAPPARSPP
jgi:hypothetical protein